MMLLLDMSMAMIPTLKALELLKQPQPQKLAVKDLVGDIFKCLAQTTVHSNESRMENILKYLLPTFKPLQPQFGDKCITQLKEQNKSYISK
jgi:hypothetical protein